MGFECSEMEVPGAYVIKGFYAGDIRGGFTKCFEKNIFSSFGIDFQLNETFVSFHE